MAESFIDNIIDRANANDWCMTFGCTTCGAYKFRAEIERAASNQIIKRNNFLDTEKSTDLYRDLEKLASDISKTGKPITGLNKQCRLSKDVFHLLQNEISNDLKISKLPNEDAIRIILNDFDLENNILEFNGTPIGNLIKNFIRKDEELRNKFLPKQINIIVIDVKLQKISYKKIDGPVFGISDSVETAIGESDRDTESGKILINGKQLGIIFGCGSRDLTGHFWRMKSENNFIFGNTAILCEDDTLVDYGPFYGQDCPLKLEELIENLVWGKMSMDSPDLEWSRDAILSDILHQSDDT